MADICIWNQCNNGCLMCSNPREFNKSINSTIYSLDAITNRVKAGHDNLRENYQVIDLTGGEPTIHRHFFEILTLLKKQHPENKIALNTNGRMFAYYDFTKKHLPYINFIKIAVHGFNPQSHDIITGIKGSFHQTITGIKNILAIKKSIKNGALIEVEIRIILTKLNYQNLEEILSFLHQNFSEINRIVLIFPEFEGICRENFHLIGITYQDSSLFIKKAIQNWAKCFKDIRLYHFPLCVLPFKLWPYTWRTLRGNEVVFLERCQKCIYKKYCLGVHIDYPEIIGDAEFQPIISSVGEIIANEGNQFIYHPIIAVK